jgi:nitrite reductase (NO-forming)
MATVPPGQPGQEAPEGWRPPPSSATGPAVPAGLFALFAVMSMLALAVSIVAIIVAGGTDDERSTPESAGPVKTVPIELGDLFVKPDRVEVPAGTHLMVEVTNNGDLVHTLNLEGHTGTDRLQPGESQTADFGVIDADTQAWCTIPGHKEAGMVLTIAVTAAAAEPPSGPGVTG